MLAYEQPAAALEWLARAFGFRERARIVGPDGEVGHAELETETGGVIMLARPSPLYQSPKTHRASCVAAARWQAMPYIVDGVLVHVGDVEKHLATSRAAGAVILSEPEDEPYGRLYRAEDLEGHRWMFLQAPNGPSPDADWVPPGTVA